MSMNCRPPLLQKNKNSYESLRIDVVMMVGDGNGDRGLVVIVLVLVVLVLMVMMVVGWC